MSGRIKNIFMFLLISVFLGASVAFTAVFADNAAQNEPSWTVSDGTTVQTAEDYDELTGLASDAKNERLLSATYKDKVDLNAGAEYSYLLKDETCFSVGDEVLLHGDDEGTVLLDNARYFDHSYVKFTVVNERNEGFEVTFYHQWSDYDVRDARTEINLAYLSPKDGEGTPDRHYIETVYDCGKNFGEWHTMSAYKENGVFYIRAGDFTFTPDTTYGKYDLQSCTVQITAKSMEIAPKICVKRNESISFQSTHGEWGTLGGSSWTYNQDGTMNVAIDDASDLVNTSDQIFLRERIFNTKGYDVNQPIVLECVYHTGSAYAVWWGVGLAVSPYECGVPFICAENGRGTRVDNGGDADYLVKHGAYICHNDRKISNPSTNELMPYLSHYADAYRTQEDLDRLEWRIGDTSTEFIYNGVKMFDIALKKTDFTDGKAYPFFQFIEVPPSEGYANEITIKGVNAPSAENAGSVVRLSNAEDASVCLTVEGGSDGLTVFEKDSQSSVKAIDSQYYTWDWEKSELKIFKEYFRDKEFGLYELYIGNAADGGLCYLPVRYHDAGDVVQAPEIGVDELVYKMYSADNLVFAVNTHSMQFNRVYGAGMYLNDSMYDETTGQIVIKSSFLATLKPGEYEIHVETVDQDGVPIESTVTLKVLKMKEAVVTDEIVVLTALQVALIVIGGVLIASEMGALVWLLLKNKKAKQSKDKMKNQ